MLHQAKNICHQIVYFNFSDELLVPMRDGISTLQDNLVYKYAFHLKLGWVD